jgi:hypothetical protein
VSAQRGIESNAVTAPRSHVIFIFVPGYGGLGVTTFIIKNRQYAGKDE